MLNVKLFDQIPIPEEIKNKWQSIITTMANLLNVPAGLIMRLVDSDITVFLSSETENNPYLPFAKEHFDGSGLYCETAIKSNKMLLVPNALADDNWKNNPDVNLGMISYLGFPIIMKDNTIFGTICVLDNKENSYSRIYEKLVADFRDSIVKDLELICANNSLENLNFQLNKKITEITFLLEEKKLILKEVHHRIKNNMNTMHCLLMLQASDMNDSNTRKALEDAAGRIYSMAILYDKLYQSSDFSELSIQTYLSTLIDDIIANFSEKKKIRVEKQIADFILDSNRLQSIGIIINELLTNIMKYAFVGKSDGLVIISAMLSDNHITISVSDNGIGIPESINFKNSTGFGMILIQTLAKQLNGEIRINRENGTKFILEFDL